MKPRQANLSVVLTKADVEFAIHEYKKLDEKIKTLEAKKSVLKDSMIKSYFANNDSYFNDDGVCLATYKPQIRQVFNTTDFKKDHLSLYNAYTVPHEIHVFLIKK